MRVLASWLRELVDVDATDEELSDRLTFGGLEVEAVHRLDQGFDNVVVGEVRAREPVPDTHLAVCRVFDGAEELQIVCGAQNYEVGDKVPLARIGAVLPGGMAIGQAKLRGIDSFGMLCSARELGLSADHEGLLILPRDTEPGRPIAEVTGRTGVAFDLNVTPNRADALSHLGVARELAALFDAKVRAPVPVLEGETGEAPAQVGIDAPDRCTHYAARVIEGVQVGPSPTWLVQKLEGIGQRPINNVVDATNFVLHELGQPLHAFDLDKLDGSRVVARLARPGETIRTLDGVDRTLNPDDLVIADAVRPAAIAGVMGGEDSSVTEGTTRLLLESAYFNPGSVRRSARRHALHSDASHRFERGVDPTAIRLALDRLAEVILQIAGGQLAGGVIEQVTRACEPRTVRLRRPRISAVLGTDVPWGEALDFLARLGLREVNRTPDEVELEVPGHRGDLTAEIDLIEEIARLRGYDTIEPTPLSSSGTSAGQPADAVLLGRVRASLSGSGYDEALNFAFTSREDAQRISPDTDPIALRNPIAADLSVMRPSLLPNLLRNAAHNLRHGAASLRLYEMGRAYLRRSGPPEAPERSARFRIADEPRRVALVAFGRRDRPGWTESKDGAFDFYDLKGAVEQLFEAANLKALDFEHTSASHLHPRSATRVRSDELILGTFGELHPVVADELELPRGVFVAELELEALLGLADVTPRYHGVPRFPASLRDLAVVVDERVAVARVKEEIATADPDGLVESVTLFDVYQGAPLPPGRKNLAWSLSYRAKDRTLTDDEVNRVHDAIVKRLVSALGAELRG